MVMHIKSIALEVIKSCKKGVDHGPLFDLFPEIVAEIDKLDPQDFVAAHQGEFLLCRRELKKWAGRTSFTEDQLNAPRAAAEKLIAVIDEYQGSGSGGAKRDFSFVADVDVRGIVERDYEEVNQQLLPGRSWKSSVVMSGSILEAVLYDQLTCTPTRVAAAMGSGQAPRKRGGAVRDITVDTRADEWSLSNLIEVAVDIGVLPGNRANSIDQILRDWRNFVHPRKELRSSHSLSEAEATAAKGMLDGVLNHLT